MTPPASSCAFSGLTNGVNYTLTTTATNVEGTSAPSPSTATLVDILPIALQPRVEVGTTDVTVSVATDPTGGAPQIHELYIEPGGHRCTVTSPATSCFVPGLTVDTNYTVTTSAVNGIGTSPSSPSVTTLVDVTPVASSQPSVEVGSGGVTVSVSSPPGGGSTQSFTLYIEPGGHTCTVPNPTTTPRCFVPLPSNGTYTVTTTATSTIGTSPPSPSNNFQFNAPAVPAINSVTIGLGQVTVRVAPGSGGGAPQSIAVFAGPGSCMVVPPATSCSIGGLAGGQSYTVTASATNGVGTTPNNTGLLARLIPPNAPPAPTVVIDDGAATAYVVPPTGGEDPTGYTVTAQPGNHSCTVTPPDVSCNLSGLTNGTQYSFSVVASNAYGPSPSGAATLAMVAEPPVPQAPSVVPGNGQATVTVNPGTGGGSASVYIVSADLDGTSCEVTPPATSCVLAGLTNGTPYTVTVRAANGVGTSTVSAAAVVTPEEPRTQLPPAPVPADPATGALPALAPGALTVIVDGQPVVAQVEVVGSTEVVVRTAGFDLTLSAECPSGCTVTTTARVSRSSSWRWAAVCG